MQHYQRHQQEERQVTDRWHELSIELSYALTADPVNELALLSLILGQPPPPAFRAPLLEAVSFLITGYGQVRRKSGPLAVLHPLRTTAIIARLAPRLEILDLLGAFLHDRDEDLKREQLAPERWGQLQQRLERLLGTINSEVQWFLGERIAILSRKHDQTYFDYLKEILQHARVMPDLIRIKLADKLDSTYDIQVPPSRFERLDFYRVIFDALFVPGYRGLGEHQDYFLVGEREAVLLLSTLAKNALFLSLLRTSRLDKGDPTIERLFESLAIASIRQARWVVLELFASSIPSTEEQRRLLKDVLAYRDEGAIAVVTAGDRGHHLDGTLLERFFLANALERKEKMRALYADRALFTKVVIAMLVVFSCFVTDDRFTIAGIDASGIRPVR